MHAARGSSWRNAAFSLVRDRRVAFLVVGAFNTVLGTAWFIGFQLLNSTLHVGRFDYLLSLVSAQLASLLCSFVAQRYLVFRVRGQFWADFFRFAAVSTTAFFINLALLTASVELLSWPKIPAQLAVTAVIAVGTYVAHRDFSFRRSPHEVTAAAGSSTQSPSSVASPPAMPSDEPPRPEGASS